MIPSEQSFGPTLPANVIAALNNEYASTITPEMELEMERAKLVAAKMTDLPATALMAQTIVICSIWPEPLESRPFTHNGMGRKVYRIGAGTVEKPAYLAIQNAFDYQMTRGGGGAGEAEKANYNIVTIRAAEIARDIIQYWAGDFSGNAYGMIGVGIVRGQLSDDKIFSATKEEIAELVGHQNAMLKKLVERADAMWDANQRERIGRTHRRALAILGLDETQHPWYRSKVQAFATCPRCAEQVKAEAQGCKHCGVDFAKWFDENPMDYKPGIWLRVDSARLRKSAAAASVESKPLPVVPPVQHPNHQQGKR